MSESAVLTVPELLTILAACAGPAEPVEATDADLGDTTLADLGYDSLAVLEAASRIERQFVVSLPEEEVVDARTLNRFVELVNGRIAQGAGSR